MTEKTQKNPLNKSIRDLPEGGKTQKTRLTQLARGGGCGCKVSAARLQAIMADLHFPPTDNLLVGAGSRDDASVVRLNDELALVSSLDFFAPVVDDPYDFGRIAAANAISDIYAMGGRPLMALNVLGVPFEKMSEEQVSKVLAGGAERCRQAGIPIAGGHSVECAEPLYGLAVNGVLNPACMKTNAGARAGDVLVLGKPLGIGVLSAALRAARLSAPAYQSLVSWSSLLNTAGLDFAGLEEVHAMTDVTGFGLLGHLFEICLASRVDARLEAARVPWIESAVALAKQGVATSASRRNLDDLQDQISGLDELEAWQRNLLSDPQTGGGLLLSCAEHAAEKVLSIFNRHACSRAAVIGCMSAMRKDQPVIHLHAA